MYMLSYSDSKEIKSESTLQAIEMKQLNNKYSDLIVNNQENMENENMYI